MTTLTPTPAPTALHPFYETLGPGPYRFVGCYDLGAAQDPTSAANFGNLRGWLADAPKLKAGLGTCAHCGTAILNICIVRVGNGDLYGVGEDCVEKCSQGGLWKGAKAALAARRNAMARARKAAIAAAKWEAERPEREARQREQQSKWQAAFEAAHTTVIERFTRHRGILEWLVGPDLTQSWLKNYTARHPGYCGQIHAEFSPPCDLSNFHQSLAIQLVQRGTLSPRQADCIASGIYGRAKKHETNRTTLIATLTA
jgi:hypothetical protein